MKTSELKRKTELRANSETTRTFEQRGRTNSRPKRRAVSPASSEQRAKVKDRLCVNCADDGPCDPAHLTARAQGGCDHPDCVLPLCRECHRGLDAREGPQAQIDLEPVLALREFATERAHMASHLSYRQCIQRLTGERT